MSLAHYDVILGYAQVMSYGERKAKREQEIEGLKEALTILSGEALLQAPALGWASC